LTEKQKRFADEYITRTRLRACRQLAGRYLDIGELVTQDLLDESIEVIRCEKATGVQKTAARIILELKYGKIAANDLVEDFAIVRDRSDPLVRRWVRKIRERDEVCQVCGSDKYLEVHHISHWADDPVNRIKLENGVLLCSICHAKQHPNVNIKMFGGAKHER